jgi:hypothetical protein
MREDALCIHEEEKERVSGMVDAAAKRRRRL